MGKTRNTGKLATQIQFDNSNNLVIGNSTSSSFNTSGSVNAIGGITGSIFGIGDPTSFSASISSDLVNLENKSASVDISISNINNVTSSNLARLSNLETKSSSVDISISNINSVTSSNLARLSNLESKSASVDISITNINSITSSNLARLSNLETKSASVDISITNINSFTASNNITSLNSKTGSYATTGSNTFFGTQTYSGSVYIANDLVVQGSSSIQYISASSVSIGTNIVQLNTANPTVRFAGLTVIDSGSIGGSGSFLYDSVEDEFIFVHRGNGTNVTSSHFIMGPETFDNLGNETYLTCNILTKGTGKEHLVDSCIFDNGTTTCIKNNLVGTGTISGTTIYGSTAVCSAVGKFTSCIDAGAAIFSANSTTLNVNTSTRVLEVTGKNSYYATQIIGGTGTGTSYGLSVNAGTNSSDVAFQVYNQTETAIRLFVRGDGNVGIGTNSPNFKTHISTGSDTSITQPTAGTYGLYIQQNSSGNVGGLYIQDGASNSGNSIFVGDNNGVARFVVNTDGNVLVGSSSNDFGKLDITVAPSSYTAALGLGLQTNSGEGNSVGISFKTKVSLSGVIWENARIAAFTDSISLSAYGALAFYTMNATTLSERMRIASDGNVGIKCTSPGVSLVVGTTDALKLPTGTTAQRPSGASGLIRMNSTTGQPEWYDSVSSSWVSFASQIGTCTYDVQYLVVGGGGGGGMDRAGAGGAGGYRLDCMSLISGTSYYAIIGAGGASNSYGTQGCRSAFNGISSQVTVEMIGGGAGGSGNNTYAGTAGGSGGGGGNSNGGCSNAGGAGTTGQGNAGGSGVYSLPNYGAGGGGGAGGVGANGTCLVSGDGGVGCQNSICGVSRYYAGGGGAGNYGEGTMGLGGAGGGGNGNRNGAGCPGAANSGGGGGSEGTNTGAGGGAGGSGIVIIRYCGSQRGKGGTIVSCNGHTIHIFLSSTMYTA